MQIFNSSSFFSRNSSVKIDAGTSISYALSHSDLLRYVKYIGFIHHANSRVTTSLRCCYVTSSAICKENRIGKKKEKH